MYKKEVHRGLLFYYKLSPYKNIPEYRGLLFYRKK